MRQITILRTHDSGFAILYYVHDDGGNLFCSFISGTNAC